MMFKRIAKVAFVVLWGVTLDCRDDQSTLGSQVTHGRVPRPHGGESGVVESISPGKMLVTHEGPEDPALVYLPDKSYTFDHRLVDIKHEYAYLKGRVGYDHPSSIELAKARRQLTTLQSEKLDMDRDSEQNNGSLAVVQWVLKGTHHQAMLEVKVPHAKEVSDMMDANDMETTTMDIKDNNFQQMV
uniref:Uncharacterized protein n=1 Tax=Tanacetum cinerariifolium TaxID=118510 RepID=A0A6L2NNB8_TANCI|nr:hypothetical protein [Tanacetum cinerariifolium]